LWFCNNARAVHASANKENSMELKKSKKLIATGIILIVVGLCLIGFDLFPIYQFRSSASWPKITGIVSDISTFGIVHFRHTVTFMYRVGSKNYQSWQIIPNDSWANGLRKNSLIPIRYASDKPESALIDHPNDWGYVFLACWNSIWLIGGALLICRSKR
jgi:Protein of unknown function (DUF3592)